MSQRARAKLLGALERNGGPFTSQARWAKAAGVGVMTLERALKTEAFRAEIYAYITEPLLLNGRAMVEKAIGEGLKDSFLDRKLILELLGLAPRQQRDVTAQVDVRVWDLPRELARIRAEDQAATQQQPSQGQPQIVEGTARLLPSSEDDHS